MSTAATPGAHALVSLPDADALRDHLDALNDAGQHPVAVDIDSTPQPFLITLVGPYVESEAVFLDSPWQDECQGQVHGINDLRYPATVLDRLPASPLDGVARG